MYLMDGWASLTAFSNSKIAEIKAAGLSTDLAYVDWDTHANMLELPNRDLVGPGGCSLTETEEAWNFDLIIGVATHADKNLFKHRQIIDAVFRDMTLTKTIPFYDWRSGVVKGSLVFQEGTSALPMGRSENHAIQYIRSSALILRTEAP